MHRSIQVITLCLLGVKQVCSQVTTNCPLLGPVLPAPTNPASATAVANAQSTFAAYLDGLLDTGTTDYGTLDTQTTSFSINIFSAHDETSLFSYHYEAPGLNGSLTSGQLNDDTLYRIGSLSKLLTVYTLLIQVGDAYLDDPVTKYVPELAAAAAGAGQVDVHNIRWEDITIRALGSHLSGIPRDYNLEDVADLGLPNLSNLGLPPLNSSEVPTCGVSSETLACSREEFLQGMIASDPLASTYNTPIYSNGGVQILAYAMEKITKMSYADAFNAALGQPLGLNRTFLSQPRNNDNAIIPFSQSTSFWDVNLGDGTPDGGIYSTMADLATVGRSILLSSLITPTLTRKWMKPETHTSSLYSSVGMPWEIERMEVPLTNGSTTTRVVDLYTKGGDIGAYGGYFVLSPDHDFGFSVFAAGAYAPYQPAILADLIVATWISAFEDAAREQAQINYAGTYSSTQPSLNSSITISLDERPGLGIQSWISNGTDMLQALASIPTVGVGAGQNVSVRLYPTGLQSGNEIAFRASFDALPQPIVGKVFSMNCDSWVMAGSANYGEVALGNFIVEVDQATGQAVSISPRALRVTLEKQA